MKKNEIDETEKSPKTWHATSPISNGRC